MNLRDTPKINNIIGQRRGGYGKGKKLKRVSKRGKKNRMNYNKDIRTNRINE